MFNLLVIRIHLLKKIARSISTLLPVKNWLRISPDGLVIKAEDETKGRLDVVTKIDGGWFSDYCCDRICTVSLDFEQLCSALDSATEDASLAVVVGDDKESEGETNIVLEFLEGDDVTQFVTVGIKKQENLPWAFDTAVNIHNFRVVMDPQDFARILQHAIESNEHMMITVTGICIVLAAGSETVTLKASNVMEMEESCILRHVPENMHQTLQLNTEILPPIHAVAHEARYICIHDTAYATDKGALIECSFGDQCTVVFFLPKPVVLT